ncbi:MAG TPA: hypothetical protein VNN79_16565 [Actinomycetota bacterium]|nr:hypothetical protein [Actinomycetota bacterium]
MRSARESVSATAAATRRDRLLIAARRGEDMEGSPDQQSALIQAAAALDRAGIAYALIGGSRSGFTRKFRERRRTSTSQFHRMLRGEQ